MSIPTVVWTWVLYSFGSPADCFLQWIPTYNVSAVTLFPVLWSRKGTYNSLIIPVLPKSLHLWMLGVVPTSMQRWWSMKSTDFRCGCLLNPCCSFKDPGWLGKPVARGTSLTNSPNCSFPYKLQPVADVTNASQGNKSITSGLAWLCDCTNWVQSFSIWTRDSYHWQSQ